MAASQWPPELPQGILMEGNSDTLPDGRMKSPTEMGPGKVRLRTSAAIRKLSGRMYMSTDQLQILRNFVETTTLGGSLPFMFPDPLDQAFVLVQFGDSLPSWINVSGDKYDVALIIEVLP